MKQKLKFKPTPISRLFRHTKPLHMVGDPDWYGEGKRAWLNREKAVYAYEMEKKSWSRPWSPELWKIAWHDNYILDEHIRVKWLDYDAAWNEHAEYVYAEALRDNEAWNYHHDNYLAA
jgi:hypothetical protein